MPTKPEPIHIQAWKCPLCVKANIKSIFESKDLYYQHIDRSHYIQCFQCEGIAETPVYVGEPMVGGIPYCSKCVKVRTPGNPQQD